MNRPPFVPSSNAGSAAPRFASGWRARLAKDPIPMLLREGSPALAARIRRELIDDDEAPKADEILSYAEVKAFLKKQGKKGEFAAKPVEKALGPEPFATALSTLRALERSNEYGLGVDVPEVKLAAEALLASQDAEGALESLAVGEKKTDKPKHVAVHFHGWALAALCRAGLDADPRIEKGFRWLLNSRQADGGWAWRGVRTESAARPSSHLVTGMALRAFASSPSRKTSREARRAAELLATRFLQPDRYPDRKAARFWEEVSEPRLWTDVTDALDTVTSVGLGKENSGVRTAEAYVRGRQTKDGLWYPGGPDEVPKEPSAKEKEEARWLTVRTLVVLRRVN